MTAYGIRGVKLNNTTYIGVRGYMFDRKRQFHSAGYDGNVLETHHSIIQTKNDAEITTLAMKTMISALGTSGTSQFPFLALDGVNGAVLYGAAAAANAPGYNASAVHTTKTCLNGVVVMEGVKWTLGQPAEMSLRTLFTATSGSTDPIVTATNAALPADSSNSEAFTLSALTVNGVSLTTVESLEISVAHKWEHDFTTGLPFPTTLRPAGANGQAEIRMNVSVRDVSLAEGTGSVSAVFTSLAQGGTLGASTVTFTFQGNYAAEEQMQGQHASPMTKSMVVRPRWDGVNLPLLWAVT